MSDIDTQEFRRLLNEERARIVAAIDNIHHENPSSLGDETQELSVGYDQHPADVASETHDREVEYTLEDNAEQVLAGIDAALIRVDEGTYGTCQRCARPIGEDRLRARPWATLCIDCQRLQERP